jgi:RNA polymerase sigma-70 factor (ECF subfamily)
MKSPRPARTLPRLAARPPTRTKPRHGGSRIGTNKKLEGAAPSAPIIRNDGYGAAPASGQTATRRAPASAIRVLPALQSSQSDDKAELIALLRRTVAGHPAAQAELVRRYTRRIAGLVRGIMRQPEAVEDATQMVFIKMFRRLPHLRDLALFEAWLFTLARNTAIDLIRRRNCRPITVMIDDQVRQIADPTTASACAEIMSALDHALARLTPLDRHLVTQVVAGERYQTIANRSGLSLTAVKVRLHRARQFLRSSVGEITGTRRSDGRGWGSASIGRLAA